MRGGRRPGAGRPKTVQGARRHFLYSTEEEYEQAKKRLEWDRKKEKLNFKIEEEDYVFDCLANAVPGQPLFLETLFENCHGRIESKDRYKQIVDKLVKENPSLKIREYEQGIYYRVVRLCSTDSSIDIQDLIRVKYMKNDEWYPTGCYLLNTIGLTNTVPSFFEIISNSVDENTIDEKLKVKIFPAKIKITKDNRLYFTCLDAISMIDDSCVDAKDPLEIMRNFIKKKKLDFKILSEIALKYYDDSVCKNLFILIK